MENTAAVLLPDLMRFRKYVDKDAFPSLPWKQDRLSEQVSAASKSRWISWWLVICRRHWPSPHGSSLRIMAPSCSLLQTNSRIETQTPPRPHFKHIVSPYKLCESKRTYTLRISKLEVPRLLLFFQILINWWFVVVFEKQQQQQHTIHPWTSPSIQSAWVYLILFKVKLISIPGGNFLFNEQKRISSASG